MVSVRLLARDRRCGWSLCSDAGSERLTGTLLDRLTHHIHILEMNGESYSLKRSRETAVSQVPDDKDDG